MRTRYYRPLKCEPGNKRLLLVATYYFTKWMKVWALTTIIVQDMRKFIWEDIIHHFDLLYTIISNNGEQLDAEDITTLSSSFGIKHNFSVPYQP